MVLRYNYNKEFFFNETPELAYFLGFFIADGYMCCSPEKYRIAFGLAVKDKVILDKFVEWICPELKLRYSNTIKNGKNSPHIVMTIDNKEIITYLKDRYRINTNKTFNEVVPYNLPNELMPHFIRGYFDGDGCVTLRKGSNRALIKICGGSYNYLIELSKLIGFGEIYKHQNIFELTICNNYDVKRFADYIYSQGGFRLERKWNIFESSNTSSFCTTLDKNEIDFIKQNFNIMTIRDISKKINRDYETVRKYSIILGRKFIKKNKRLFSNEELLHIIKNYNPEKNYSSIKKLAKELNRHYSTLDKKIKMMNLKGLICVN